MPSFLPDTSCMVAAVCGWHPDHLRSASEIRRRLSRGEELIVAAPALLEAYSVLTRLPPPNRVLPTEAFLLLETSFIGGVKVVALSGRAYLRSLREAPTRGIAGGRAYDAVIAACTVQAGAEVLLTLNARHFRELERAGLRVVVPQKKPQ